VVVREIHFYQTEVGQNASLGFCPLRLIAKSGSLLNEKPQIETLRTSVSPSLGPNHRQILAAKPLLDSN
jgi:hypothetical protein